MTTVQLRLKNSTNIILEKCHIADGFLSRLCGLLGYDSLKDSEGMLFVPGKQVHSFFMRFPIDLVFLDSGLKIVGLESLKPWRVSGLYLKAQRVLEVEDGFIKKHSLKMGDELFVVNSVQGEVRDA